jgi:hypothetical protein
VFDERSSEWERIVLRATHQKATTCWPFLLIQANALPYFQIRIPDILQMAQLDCYRPLGVPGKEEQIMVVFFVNENQNNNELKRLQSVMRVCQQVESCT